MKTLSKQEIEKIVDAPEVVTALNRWLARGDGVAIYENQDFGHPDLGHKRFASFGSEASQFPGEEPPQRMPDFPREINWRYQLVGTYRGAPLTGGE